MNKQQQQEEHQLAALHLAISCLGPPIGDIELRARDTGFAQAVNDALSKASTCLTENDDLALVIVCTAYLHCMGMLDDMTGALPHPVSNAGVSLAAFIEVLMLRELGMRAPNIQ